MKRGIVGRVGPLWLAAVAVAIAASTDAHAAAAKAKPVVVGQLVLGGVTSDVTAYSWEVTAATNFTSGGGASVGKPNPGAIDVTKRIDASSVPALLKIALGAAFPTAVFTVTFGKGKDTSTMVYELEDLFVTKVSQGAVDGVVTEEVSFVFKTVRWTFTSSAGDVTTGTWDVVSGAAS
jgi:type VI protein secretion system component Hcp